MCGILFSNDTNLSDEVFQKTLNLMQHRGPDAVPGLFTNKTNKLGHTRLKILDLHERNSQPFWSADKRYVIAYNGEIYNYRELAKEFRLQLKTTGDTEVLVELFALLGPQMLKKLNGMFAMVILDIQTEKVFLARDRLGIKPLYYSKLGDTLIVASEIDPVLELTGNRNIDDIGLRQYRKLRAFFNGRTLYEGIRMFPAGHYMSNYKIKKYWKFPEGRQVSPEKEELYSLIDSAVNYRCISDVPVGCYLSGGLDSTIIVGLASKPHSWTVGFDEHNEFEWAKKASNKFKSTHCEILIDGEEFLSLAKFMIKKRSEPLSVPNEVMLYKMTLEVKKKNTVILSGEGADELFFGYDRIFRWAVANKWNIEEFSELYAYGSHDDIEIVEDAVSPFLHYGETIDIVAAFFQIAHLHGLLRRLDNSTMLCSVEARVPFVDHRLIERMAGTPFDYRIRKGIVKHPLKSIFSNLVPREIIDRKKIGFPVPLDLIPFDSNTDKQGMDKWLEFNLSELGVECSV